MWKFNLILLTISVALVHCQVTFLDNLLFRPFFRAFRNFSLEISRHSSLDIAYARNLNKGKLQPQIPENLPFFCDVQGPGRRSLTPPLSVHMLKPGDIDIVGAIGDSLTAGNGGLATDLMHIFVESRGVAFSIGGDKTWREYLTIPNILKEYNPNLYGYSVSESPAFHQTSKFNVAEFGAMSRDMPHMARELVRRMRNDRYVKPDHWKLVNFLIGANDFCLDICYRDDLDNIVASHERDVLKTFRTIRDNLPRVMLNVLITPPLKVLLEFRGKNSECETLHHFECPCLFGFRFERSRRKYFKILTEFQKIVVEISEREEFNNRADFVVNIQPFLRNVIFPSLSNGDTDFSYLSFDCFHFSQRGHALTTTALWNNMFEPYGNKSEGLPREIFEPFLCPTEEHPFIRTRLN